MGLAPYLIGVIALLVVSTIYFVWARKVDPKAPKTEK
jgi:hypothetical protein